MWLSFFGYCASPSSTTRAPASRAAFKTRTPSSRRFGPCARYCRASGLSSSCSPASRMPRGPSSRAASRDWNRAAIRASVEAPPPGTADNAHAANTSGPARPAASAIIWFRCAKLRHAAAGPGTAHLHQVSGLQLADALDHHGSAQVIARIDDQEKPDAFLGDRDLCRAGALLPPRVRLGHERIVQAVALAKDGEGVSFLDAVFDAA